MKKYKFIFLLLIGAALISCNSSGQKTDGQEEETKEPQEEVAQPNQLTQAEIDDGWTLIFDGKTTANFRGYGKETFPEEGWEVVDGTLHCIGSGKGEAGGKGGDIIIDKKYGNFELSLEWKISEAGNSGIFYLAQEIEGDPIYKSSPEMQILDNFSDHPDVTLGKDGNRQGGSLYDLIPAVPQNAKGAGEWNHVKVTIFKGTVIHWMNGENVVEYHLWTQDWKDMVGKSKFKDWPNFVDPASEGYIGLQDHGDDVWFRNIKIKEL